MLYKIALDATYLVCLEARSREGSYYYLENKDDDLFNRPVYVLLNIIKNVMSIVAKSKVTGLFMNTQHDVPI